MQALFTNPAIQAAVAPFVAALLIALVLQRISLYWLGLAIIGGLLTTLMLTTGLSLLPLTSTRKIIIGSLCLPFTVPLMESLVARVPAIAKRWQTIITILVPATLVVAVENWIIWPVLRRQELAEAWPMLLGVSLYVSAISVAFLMLARVRLPEKSATQGANAVMLALGTGATSLIAASALYAQLAFAVSAAVGSLILITFFARSRAGLGQMSSFSLFAAAVPLALLGASATVYAQLPVWVLLCLVAVPLFGWWPSINIARPWMRLMFASFMALLPVILAVWIAWKIAGPVSF
jgi:hypothetical protein